MEMGIFQLTDDKVSTQSKICEIRYLNGVPYEALDVSDSKIYKEKELEESSIKASRLRLWALVVSWVSVIFAFSSGVVAIVLGQLLESESLFGYGLDGVLDSFSSIAVLWRFYGTSSSVAAESKERKACIIISFFFFFSAFSLIYKSSLALDKGEKEEEEGRYFTDIFSSCCGVIEIILASLKVYLGIRLDSRSLITDSIITYVGGAMSFLGVLSLELYHHYNSVWYLDAVFGLVCGIFLFFFGIKLLVEMTCLYKQHQKIQDST